MHGQFAIFMSGPDSQRFSTKLWQCVKVSCGKKMAQDHVLEHILDIPENVDKFEGYSVYIF